MYIVKCICARHANGYNMRTTAKVFWGTCTLYRFTCVERERDSINVSVGMFVCVSAYLCVECIGAARCSSKCEPRKRSQLAKREEMHVRRG